MNSCELRVKIDQEKRAAFKAACAKDWLTMQDCLELFIDDYIRNYNNLEKNVGDNDEHSTRYIRSRIGRNWFTSQGDGASTIEQRTCKERLICEAWGIGKALHGTKERAGCDEASTTSSHT